MKANKYISQIEHKLLLIFAFTAFAFVLVTFTWQEVKYYDHYVSGFRVLMRLEHYLYFTS